MALSLSLCTIKGELMLQQKALLPSTCQMVYYNFLLFILVIHEINAYLLLYTLLCDIQRKQTELCFPKKTSFIN